MVRLSVRLVRSPAEQRRRIVERTALASALIVSLPDGLDEFVSRGVREEAYADASEYLGALIRADRCRAVEEKIERLVEEALESAPPETMTDADWNEMHRALEEAGGSR
jgi:Arc/MetJ-type ribon-helix-helix transcriptional regulator